MVVFKSLQFVLPCELHTTFQNHRYQRKKFNLLHYTQV
jgi:hypothetical protein